MTNADYPQFAADAEWHFKRPYQKLRCSLYRKISATTSNSIAIIQ